MSEEIVRRAGVGDAAAVSDVWLRSRRTAAIPPPVHTDDEVRVWVANFLIPSREVWVAMEGSEVVGMLVLDEDWVDQLYVSPEHQRQGHGARLLAVAQTQRRSLVLWTFESNLGASRFYEAQGFALDGSPSSENEERAPAVCYRWRAI